MPEKEGKDRMNWEYVFTNAQEKEIVESAMDQLAILLDSKHVKDIREDLIVFLSEGEIDEKRLALTSKGLIIAENRKTLQSRIEKDQWANLIKKYKVTPGRIEKIKELVETSLVEL